MPPCVTQQPSSPSYRLWRLEPSPSPKLSLFVNALPLACALSGQPTSPDWRLGSCWLNLPFRQGLVVNPAAPEALRAETVADWLSSQAALPFVRELRWALLPQDAAIIRLRSTRNCGRSSASSLADALHGAGIPTLLHSLPFWGASRPSWAHLSDGLSQHCTACWSCRGIILPPAAAAPIPCPWCRGLNGPMCQACGCVLHFRGQCRWSRGTHPGYTVQRSDQLQLCPDCLWSWLQSYAALPELQRQHTPPANTALSQHLYTSLCCCMPCRCRLCLVASSFSASTPRTSLATHPASGCRVCQFGGPLHLPKPVCASRLPGLAPHRAPPGVQSPAGRRSCSAHCLAYQTGRGPLKTSFAHCDVAPCTLPSCPLLPFSPHSPLLLLCLPSLPPLPPLPPSLPPFSSLPPSLPPSLCTLLACLGGTITPS